MIEFLTELFPELDIGWDYFEDLQYNRADIPSTLLQLAQSRYLDGVTVPPEVPCNLFFGQNDELMSLHTPEGRKDYRDHALCLIPHAEFHECEIDHFGRGPDHYWVIEKLGDIFEECEARSAFRTSLDKSELPGDANR